MQKQKNNFLYPLFSKIEYPSHLSSFSYYEVFYYLPVRFGSFNYFLGFITFFLAVGLYPIWFLFGDYSELFFTFCLYLYDFFPLENFLL
jgi:hypothetical protein